MSKPVRPALLLWLVALAVGSFPFMTLAHAQGFFWTSYTLTKSCGSDAVYAGVNRPDLHGGSCLYFSEGVYLMHTSYTTTKDCGTGTYLGPNKPWEHGGTCLWVEGHVTRSWYTTVKTCPRPGEVYVGPNRPDLHGGTCLELVS